MIFILSLSLSLSLSAHNHITLSLSKRGPALFYIAVTQQPPFLIFPEKTLKRGKMTLRRKKKGSTQKNRRALTRDYVFLYFSRTHARKRKLGTKGLFRVEFQINFRDIDLLKRTSLIFRARNARIFFSSDRDLLSLKDGKNREGFHTKNKMFGLALFPIFFSVK